MFLSAIREIELASKTKNNKTHFPISRFFLNSSDSNPSSNPGLRAKNPQPLIGFQSSISPTSCVRRHDSSCVRPVPNLLAPKPPIATYLPMWLCLRARIPSPRWPEWKNGAKNVRRKIRKMIRRLRGPGRRDRWGEGLGPAAGGFGVEDKGKACAETGDAWEGGCEDSDDEEARSCCSKSLILFWASYSLASLRSSSSLNICLLSCSVSSSPFRVSFTLFSRPEFSASIFSLFLQHCSH